MERQTFITTGFIPLKRILSQGYYELRIDLQDWNGDRRYAKYSVFNVDDYRDNYKLLIVGYSGDAGTFMKMY